MEKREKKKFSLKMRIKFQILRAEAFFFQKIVHPSRLGKKGSGNTGTFFSS